MARSSVEVRSERNPSTHDDEKRSRKFRAPLLTAVIGVPLFGMLLRFITFWAPEMLWLTAGLALTLGFALAAAAIVVGVKVAKRAPVVIGHAAVTGLSLGVALYVTATVRWPHVSAPWWERLVAVVHWPAWWVIIHLFGSLIVSGSWLLYRIDAFRSATGADTIGEDAGLAKLVRWPSGAKVRPDSIVVDEFSVTAEVDHEGIPVASLRASLPALEESPNLLRGRGSIVGDTNGGKSTIRLVHTDPHSVWRDWPGLSHPGGEYHEPFRTAYYSTGETQWYSFVRTPDGYASKLAPNFRSPGAAFKGAQGMTSSGKSGDAAIETAEALSRQHTVVVYLDPAKLLQNAAWCIDMCTLAADSEALTGVLFTGMVRWAEYRQKVLSAAGVRDFDTAAAIKTGLPWVHIFADEFDVAKQSSNMLWLATKARSLGFRFSFTLPRASFDNLDTNIRSAVGMWKQFGATQGADAGFVLPREVIDAGADPELFGATVPGAHYLAGAPGVAKELWPIDARSYRTREDFSDLRNAVLAARATFTPATLTPGELEALGDVAQLCDPEYIRQSSVPPEVVADEKPQVKPSPKMTRAERAAAVATLNEENDMKDTLGLDPETRALLDDVPPVDTADLEKEYGKLDPRAPLPETTPDTFTMPSTKPVVSTTEAVAEMEAALIRMDARNVKEFTSGDLRDEMRVAMPAAAMSKRWKAIQEDESLNPPGIQVKRIEAGKFRIVRLGDHGK